MWKAVTNFAKPTRRMDPVNELEDDVKDTSAGLRRVHMANERTFLAWIRTSIGVMAFGFVVEKFALFIKEISHVLGKSGIPQSEVPTVHGYSTIFGVLLVGIGAAMGLLAFLRYRKVEKEIDVGAYHTSPALVKLVTVTVLGIGIFLMIYLIQST